MPARGASEINAATNVLTYPEQGRIRYRSWRDDACDSAVDDAFSCRFRNLFGNGDLVARCEQPCDIAIGGMIGNAGHVYTVAFPISRDVRTIVKHVGVSFASSSNVS